MKQSWISFEQSNSFSPFFLDYIHQKPSLKPFYHFFPSVENFREQIEWKGRSFTKENRDLIAERLISQYHGVTVSNSIKHNLAALREVKTFTVVTGHQLNICTGPLYFIYKILTVINACKKLKAAYPGYHFVPVYWMASEDHDYEEISTFSLYGKKYKWQTSQTGAVGRFSTDGLEELLAGVPGDTGMFKEAYSTHKSLAEAVRYYVNKLFGDDGLIVIDADDRELKRTLIPVMRDDIFNHAAKGLVEQTNSALEKEGYHTQVFARDINFFFLDDGVRERIEQKGQEFMLTESRKSFSKEELEKILADAPEKLSPNVILRPLYQEMILPNVAYVGGPAENIYWLQLKSVFDHYKIPFPILLPRNFALVMDAKISHKFVKTGMEPHDLFLAKHELINLFVRKHAGHKLELIREKETFGLFYSLIRQNAEKIDKTLGDLVEAEAKRTYNSLSKIERKLLKAEKRFQSDKLRQLEEVKDVLFPNGSLQERSDNFLNFIQPDPSFIKKISEQFDPFDFRMNIFQYD